MEFMIEVSKKMIAQVFMQGNNIPEYRVKTGIKPGSKFTKIMVSPDPKVSGIGFVFDDGSIIKGGKLQNFKCEFERVFDKERYYQALLDIERIACDFDWDDPSLQVEKIADIIRQAKKEADADTKSENNG